VTSLIDGPPSGPVVVADPGSPGSARSRISRLLRSPQIIGLFAAALAAFLICCAIAAVTPPLSTGDETAHLDYAVQVWNGHLPVFEQGVSLRPAPPAVTPPVQWESHHPPLFYALVSPLAGPLVNSGHWIMANLAVRLFNSGLTFLIVLSIAWAAAQLRPRSDRGWALTVAAVVTTLGPVIYTGGSAYGDPLNTLLTAVALGIALRVVRFGPSRALLAAATLVAAAGALTNAEFGLTLVVLVIALVVAVLLHNRTGRRWLKAAGAAVLPIAAAALSSGWFYLRERRLTGSFQGAQPEVARRVHGYSGPRSLFEVLRDSGFQTTQSSLLRHPLDGRTKVHDLRYQVDTKLMMILLGVCLAAGVVVAVILIARAGRAREGKLLICYGLLALTLVLDAAFELHYAMTGGGSVSRYILPASLPIVILIAAGLSIAGERVRTYLLGSYLVLCYGLFGWWLLKQPHAGGQAPTGVSWWAVAGLPILLAALLVVQIRAHHRLRSSLGRC
jgi:hypothetical protein